MQASLVSAPTDEVKTPGKPHVLSDLDTACKTTTLFVSDGAQPPSPPPPLRVGTNNPKFPPAKRSEGFPSLSATARAEVW